jgi:hypothetical protein
MVAAPVIVPFVDVSFGLAQPVEVVVNCAVA